MSTLTDIRLRGRQPRDKTSDGAGAGDRHAIVDRGGARPQTVDRGLWLGSTAPWPDAGST